MSIIYAISPKHCGSTKETPISSLLRLKRLNKKLLFTLSSLFFSLLFLSLLFFLVLHPSKPQFYIREATLYGFSLSPLPRLLNSTIQATIVSKNTNSHVGIYYDRLRAYALCKGEHITSEAELPPFYQGHDDADILSTSLSGISVPVGLAFGYEVGRDQAAGKMVLRVRLDGELRWRVGSWVTGRYLFDVDCVVVIGYRGGSTGGGVMIGSTEGTRCSTNV